MVYLLLSIISSTGIYLTFKLYDQFGINRFAAIVVNYWTAFLLGSFITGGFSFEVVEASDWKWFSLTEGVLFIAIFNIMALTVERHSIMVSSLASRTAMVIPAVGLALLVPGQSLGPVVILGIVMALVGVVLSSHQEKEGVGKRAAIWLPLILFIGSGIIDLIIGHVEENLIRSESERLTFIPSIFLVAATIGTVVFGIQTALKKGRISWKDLLGGAILGMINYASIFFILKALNSGIVSSTSFFPLNNMGIILASSIVGFLMYKEQFSRRNLIGLALGLLAISLLIFG